MVILTLIAGLQLMNLVQILLIFAVQASYCVIIYKEWKISRIYENVWIKIKYITIEVAVLIFVTILLFFATIQNTNFEGTLMHSILEWIIFIAAAVAILAEIVSYIALAVISVIGIIKDCKKQKKKDEGVEDRLKEAEK